MAGNDARFRITAADNTQRAIRSVRQGLSRLDRAVMGVTRSFGGLAAAGGVGFAVKEIADAGIEFQRLERSLRFATGSSEAAAQEFAFLRSESMRLGTSLQTSAAAYTSLAAAARGTALEGRQTREIFIGVSEASRVLGLSAEQTEGALRAIEQMISKGNVQAEELRGQLGERLPGAFQMAARAMGVTTQELGKMLENGEVAASDLLPRLAQELQNTFGPEVESAAQDAQAAFNRLNTAVFELKATIANSGILDFFSSLADETRFLLGGETVAEGIDRVRDSIEKLKSIPGGEGRADVQFQIRKLREELIELLKQQEPLTAASQELSEVFVTARKRSSDYDEELAKLQGRFKTAAMRADELRASLNRFRDDLSPEHIAQIEREISRIMNDGLEEIVITAKRRFSKPLKDEFSEVEEFAKQAARNMQDAFAEFFFDPFDKGLKGMVKGFIDAIRRMLANKLAKELLGFLGKTFGFGKPAGGGGGGASKLLGFANGGQFTVGGVGGVDSQLVAFKATPGEHVQVSKNGPGGAGGGGIVINQTIDARGADEARILRVLPTILEENKERTKAELIQLRNEGRF